MSFPHVQFGIPSQMTSSKELVQIGVQNVQVETSNLPNGMYIVRVTGEDYLKTYKLTIQH